MKTLKEEAGRGEVTGGCKPKWSEGSLGSRGRVWSCEFAFSECLLYARHCARGFVHDFTSILCGSGDSIYRR